MLANKLFSRILPAAFLAASLSAAVAQNRLPKNVQGAVPASVLLTIIRHEDERRWDAELSSLVADKDARVRKRAALAAGRIGDERAVPVLIGSLRSDPDYDVRQMAAFALGEIESPQGAEALIILLKDTREQPVVRARAVEALGKIGENMLRNQSAPKAKSPDATEGAPLAEVRKAIVDALSFEAGRRSAPDRETILLGLTAALRAKPENAGAVVVRFLHYSDPRIVADALNTLARLRLKDGNDAARDLLIKHSDPVVRAKAASVLGATEDKQAFDGLLDRALHDEDLRVRVNAIRALGSLKDERAAQPLLGRGNLLAAASFANYNAPEAGKIGVPECDSFIAGYEACVTTKVPEVARDQFKKSVAQWRASWKRLANNPRTRKTLTRACTQAMAQQGLALESYGCTFESNEILEIATTLGRLLPNTSNDAAVAWMRKAHVGTRGNAVEVEVAFARMAPGIFENDPYRTEVLRPNTSWRQISRRAQGLAAIRDVIVGAATGSAGDSALKLAQEELRLLLIRPTTPDFAEPDILQAYSVYKPPDLDELARNRLIASDVIIRGTAAEVLGNQPPSDANARALIEALPRALQDKDLNDAALAILDALGKQKTNEANNAIKTALDSSDHLVRRKAVALLKANGAGDFSDRIGTVQTRNTDADYRRAIARIGKRSTATVVTSRGSFTIEVLPEDAPLTVDNFVQLARKGFFNGQMIPRVVPNFVVQAGDPRGDTNGGPGYSIRCEINEVPYDRAAVGMALSGKDTGGSQWFVTHSPQPHLDGGYTVFGRVISGMEVIDKIVRGDTIRRVVINER